MTSEVCHSTAEIVIRKIGNKNRIASLNRMNSRKRMMYRQNVENCSQKDNLCCSIGKEGVEERLLILKCPELQAKQVHPFHFIHVEDVNRWR